MKLIFCEECQDVVKLLSSERSCACGNSGGRYLEDLITTEIWGAAVPIKIDNDGFLRALRRRREGAEPSERRFEAGILSEQTTEVTRKARSEPNEKQTTPSQDVQRTIPQKEEGHQPPPKRTQRFWAMVGGKLIAARARRVSRSSSK